MSEKTIYSGEEAFPDDQADDVRRLSGLKLRTPG